MHGVRTLSRSFPIVAALAASAQALAAQERADTIRPDTVFEIEAVVVTTVRPATTTGGASAVIVRPDSLHVRPAAALEEVLRELPFVAVRENSRGQAEISVRGSESRQVAVLLDGIPLTLGWDARTDPSVVPVNGARRITLIRGLHSLLYGPNVLGGVVEVEMGDGGVSALPRPTVRAGADDLGGYSLAANGGVGRHLVSGDLTVRAGAAFADRPGLALSGAVDDTLTSNTELRANSDVRQLSGFLSTRYTSLGGAWAGATASAYAAERGVPPELHVAEPRLWRYPREQRFVGVASAGSGQRITPFGRGDAEINLAIDVGAQDIESFETAAFHSIDGTETGEDRTLTLRALADHTVGASALVTGSVTYADVHHREILDDEAPTDYRQRLWSLAAETAIRLAGSARISGGLALDGADTPETGGRPPMGSLHAWGGRLGFSTLTLRNRVRLHGAVNRRARFPALRELYSGALGRFEPNPELRPETLLGAEAGFTAVGERLEVQAVGFHHRLSDAVARVATPEGNFRRVNRDELVSTGLELLAVASNGPLELRTDAILQRVRVGDAAAESGREPEHSPAARLGAGAELELPAAFRGIADARWTSSQFCVHPELGRDVELDPTGRIDLGVRRGWSAGNRTLTASAFLDNVGDAGVYDQCGLPQPGRTFRFAIELS